MPAFPASSSPHTAHSVKDGSLSEAELVAQLNTLLKALHIPIPIVSPTDLTPSLLIALLESLLGERLPLPSIAPGKTHSKSRESANKIQKVKIFLGVLEMDVLQMDVGLSEINPRQLAEGGWNEVMFVGELLCWIGRRVGLLDSASTDAAEVGLKEKSFETEPLKDTRFTSSQRHRYPSPELDTESVFYDPSTSGTTSTKQTRLTMSSLLNGEGSTADESVTSVGEEVPHSQTDSGIPNLDEIATPSSVALSFLPPFESSVPYGNGSEVHTTYDQDYPPRCIHEVPSPSLLLSTDFDHSSVLTKSLVEQGYSGHEETHPMVNESLDMDYSVKVPVRFTGPIEPVDEEFEISSFEQSQSSSSLSNQTSHNLSGVENQDKSEVRSRTIASIHQEYERTLELLNERTRLLKELAELKGANFPP